MLSGCEGMGSDTGGINLGKGCEKQGILQIHWVEGMDEGLFTPSDKGEWRTGLLRHGKG